MQFIRTAHIYFHEEINRGTSSSGLGVDFNYIRGEVGGS